jgi:hypothetical protein
MLAKYELSIPSQSSLNVSKSTARECKLPKPHEHVRAAWSACSSHDHTAPTARSSGWATSGCKLRVWPACVLRRRGLRSASAARSRGHGCHLDHARGAFLPDTDRTIVRALDVRDNRFSAELNPAERACERCGVQVDGVARRPRWRGGGGRRPRRRAPGHFRSRGNHTLRIVRVLLSHRLLVWLLGTTVVGSETVAEAHVELAVRALVRVGQGEDLLAPFHRAPALVLLLLWAGSRVRGRHPGCCLAGAQSREPGRALYTLSMPPSYTARSGHSAIGAHNTRHHIHHSNVKDRKSSRSKPRYPSFRD